MLKKLVFGAIAAFALVALLVVATGNYKMVRRELRMALGLPKFWVTSFDVEVSDYLALPCPAAGSDPLVLLVGGQSNAANSYQDPPGPDGNMRTFMFWDGVCYKAQNPVVGSTAGMGALWPRLADRLQRQTGRDVVIISGAVGGTQIADWLDERSNYKSRLVAQVDAARRMGLAPSAVFWIQGETDAAAMLEGSTYAEQQQAVVDAFVASGAVTRSTPWIIYFSTRCLDRENTGPDIERGLHALVDPAGDQLLPGPSFTVYGDDLRGDKCHLNNRGADRATEETIAVMEREGLI